MASRRQQQEGQRTAGQSPRTFDVPPQSLAGTGLSYRILSGTTIALQRPGQSDLAPGALQLDPVRVQAACRRRP